MENSYREVSGLERVWMAAGRLAPFVIQAALRPPVRVDPVDWRGALDAVTRARPGINLRYTGWLRRARWCAQEAPVPIRQVEDWDGRGNPAFLESGLNPRTGAGAELVLAGDYAILRLQHALTDGRGMWGMADDLLRALDGRPLGGASAHGPAKINLDLPTHVLPPEDVPSPFGALARGGPGRVWRHRTLPVARPVTAQAIAALSAFAGTPLRLSVPIDLRRYGDREPNDANQTGIAHVDVPVGITVQDAHDQVRAVVESHAAAAHALAAEAIRGVPLWVMAAVGRRVARRAQKTGRFPVSATVSNMGRLPLTLRDQPVPAFVIPAGGQGLPLMMALVGGATGIECTVEAPRAIADEAALDGLLDAMSAAFGAPNQVANPA